MIKIALIIGNGFDLDLGLPTSYGNFINSEEWKNVTKNYITPEQQQPLSLIKYLDDASRESLWFDIEMEIHKFVATHTDISRQDANNIRLEFEDLKNALMDYLRRVTKNFYPDRKKLSYGIYSKLTDYRLKIEKPYIRPHIISFNYTNPLEKLIRWGDNDWNNSAKVYAHGSIEKNDIVLGCDLQDGEQVNRQLSFMYKNTQIRERNRIPEFLEKANIVIFFGHSINEMDFRYFKNFFESIEGDKKYCSDIFIITYDEESERNIRDNLRVQGILIADLLNKLDVFKFIHTKTYYNNDSSEEEDVKVLFSLLEI